MRRAIIALLIAIVAAFAVAGCGGGDDSTPPTKAEFKADYQAFVKDLDALGADVGTAVNKSGGKTNKQIEKEFGELSSRASDLASKFDDTTPPDDAQIKAAHAALVSGLNTASDDLDEISTAAGKKDLRAAGAAAGKLTRDNASVSRPRAKLDLLVLGKKPPAAATTTAKTTTTK